MRKLLFIPLAVLLIGLGFLIHRPQTRVDTKVVKQTITFVRTQTVEAAPPVYHMGDTQAGITLKTVYAPATPTAGTVSSQFMLVAIEVSGVQLDSNSKLALIYTSDGAFVQPHGDTVKDCTNCAVFLIPKTAKVDSFIYKDYSWLL